MNIKSDKIAWYQEGLKNNQDAYGRAIYSYAERWADMLEEKINDHKEFDPQTVIVSFAEETSRKADTEGITGFMYGAAVSILSEVWKYGEELKRWHNKQYNYDGDGIVNPAILTIG